MSKPDLSVKQVIVMRSDLRNTEGHKVMKGKLIAQGAHSSGATVFNQMETTDLGNGKKVMHLFFDANSPIDLWLNGSFTKACLAAKSEEHLLDLYSQAEAAGLPCVLITDAGLTEFGGVPTNTCIAIGPAYSKDIDAITGLLSLFT